MTPAQACAHKQNFPNDPVQYSDINTSNWCRHCVAVHEEEHMNKDWIEDSLKAEVTSFNNWSAGRAINIDCSDSASTNCTTALTSAEKASYDYQWEQYVNAALNTWDNQVNAPPVGCTNDARAAELACYQDILNALKAKCP